MDQTEVVLVDGDGGSTLGEVHGLEFGFTLHSLVSAPGRSTQMNRGAELSSGKYLVFLHVDTRLPPNELNLVERALLRYEAGCFTLHIDTDHSWLRLGAYLSNLRSRFNRIPFGDQSFFIRRELFLSLGGYPQIPLMEDVALMIQLKRRGIRTVILPQRSTTSARRWEKEGVYRGTFRNWFLYLLYRARVSPNRLVNWYRPHTTISNRDIV
jgi:rSAM/selenodomain-associated transferase 2